MFFIIDLNIGKVFRGLSN